MRFKSDAQRKAVFATMNGHERAWLVFGDSIALGDFDKGGGWVNRFRERVYPDHVYNLSIAGDDISGVSDRMKDESGRRLKNEDTAKLILAIGINDTKNDVSNDSVRKKFEGLLDEAEKILNKDDITVVGLTPINSDVMHPSNDSFDESKIKKLNKFMGDECRDRDISFVEVFGDINDKDLDDGLHPNAGGHEEIFDAVRKSLGV